MSVGRKVAIVFGLYVIEGFPMGVFRDFWPVFLRHSGVSLTTIGALSGLYLAWSAKALWSPLVDRFGERRRWIAGPLLVMAGALALFSDSEGVLWLPLMWTGIGLLCLASATQDIAIDAYTIGIVDRGEEGWINSVRIVGYRGGLILAGGGLLLLPSRIGWGPTHLVACGLVVAMAAWVFTCPKVEVPAEARHDVLGAFRGWRARGGVIPVLAFILLFRLADLAMAPMLKPFWVDRGLSNEEIATISTTLGAVATIAGAGIGGWIVTRVGIGWALVVVGALSVGSNLAYAAAALPDVGRTGIYAASVVESLCGGLAAAGFLAFLMRICEREHAAVQYATLTGMYALPGAVAGAVSGAAVESVGYASYFAATALLGAPAFAFLPWAWRWIGPEASGSQE